MVAVGVLTCCLLMNLLMHVVTGSDQPGPGPAGRARPSTPRVQPVLSASLHIRAGACVLSHNCVCNLTRLACWLPSGLTQPGIGVAGLLNPPPEKETGISTALNAGKVKFAQIAGDKAIVKAIYNNSNDAFTAYSEVSKRSDFSSKTIGLAKKLAPEAEEARSFFDKWQAAQ